MKHAKTAILSDPVYKRHATGRSHPEQSARMDAVVNALEASGAMADALRIPGSRRNRR